jgi:hypothetical protein
VRESNTEESKTEERARQERGKDGERARWREGTIRGRQGEGKAGKRQCEEGDKVRESRTERGAIQERGARWKREQDERGGNAQKRIGQREQRRKKR